jgi:lipid A 3-O-deacylase
MGTHGFFARVLRRLLAAVSLSFLFIALPALGAEEAGSGKSGTFSFVLDNDFQYDTDGGYSGGLGFVWVPGTEATPGWALRVARAVPWIPREGRVRHGYVLGHNTYTPSAISLVEPPPGERPYAGWLFGAVGLGIETGRQLDQLALTLGVVGPAALAEPAQKLIHDVTGSNEPMGWDTQLENELGIVLTWQRNWRGWVTSTGGGRELDLTPNFGGSLGNVYTYANAGVMMRYGKQLGNDYGPPRFQPGLPGSGFFVSPHKGGWYLFVGLEGRAVARNIFLDGNTFRDSRSVDKEPLVGDLQFGFVFNWRTTRLSYTHVMRSREFEGQTGDDDFGTFSLTKPF